MDDRLPLTFNIESRAADTSKDSRVVNAIIEGEDIVKRQGLLSQTYSGATISVGQAQGIFSWDGGIVAASNGHVYKINGLVATELTGSPYSGMSSTVPLSYTQTVNDNWLVFHDGANIYVVNKVDNKILSPLSGTGVLTTTITKGGGYYTAAPTVTFTASPAGSPEATGHAVLYNNQVSSITVDTPGTYVAGVIPSISMTAVSAGTTATCTSSGNQYWTNISAGPARTATGYTTVNSSGAVTGVGISDGGAYASASSGWYKIIGCAIVSGGSGYLTTALPTVTFPPGSGGVPLNFTPVTPTISAPVDTTATATANLSNTTAGPYVPGIVYLDGSVYVMTTGVAVPKVSTVTVTIASPAVVGWAAHGLAAGTQIIFSTTGALPTGITAGTIYYVITAGLAAGAFEISTTLEGTPIVTSGTQSGVQTATATSQTPAVIYGSGMNNPTSWNALDFIKASSDPDQMVGIARHLNYILAFGTMGTQFFYDAALASPASPLATNKSAYLEIGCANGYSIASAEQTLIWVGTAVTGGRSVYVLNGLSPVKVSNRYIDKYLNKCDMSNTNGIFVRSYCFKVSGHTLYVLTMKDLNVTFIYDLDEKKWYQWTSQSGDTGVTNSGTETFFSPTSFTGNTEYVTTSGIYLQDDANGKIYKMSVDYLNDDTNAIYFRAVSPILDNGTKKRKFYKRVEAVGDVSQGNVYIRKTDDDYVTWSTYRTMLLSDKRPILYQYGEARRRAWEVFSSDSIPIRLSALEIEFDIGEQGQGQQG